MNFEAVDRKINCNKTFWINEENNKKFYDKYIKQYKKISVPFIH